MGKLLKYELRGNYRKSFPVIFAGIILCLILLIFYSDTAITYNLLLSLVFIVVTVVIYIDIFNSFKNELYSNSGYLTFTLPVSTKKILVSKILAAFIVSYGATILLIFFAAISPSNKTFLNNFQLLDVSVLMIIVDTFVGNLCTILLVYLVISVTKISAINGKIGGFVGVIIFIALSIGLNYIRGLIYKLEFLDVNLSNTFDYDTITNSVNLAFDGASTLNIGVLVFNIVLIIAMFFGVSYLLDNEVNI
ncbi:hypothetical protein [Clostridium sp. DL1XJH146]